jgi:putative transposase
MPGDDRRHLAAEPRVVRELDAIVAVRGRPAMIVSNNGTELTSRVVLHWSQEMRVEWH